MTRPLLWAARAAAFTAGFAVCAFILTLCGVI